MVRVIEMGTRERPFALCEQKGANVKSMSITDHEVIFLHFFSATVRLVTRKPRLKV